MPHDATGRIPQMGDFCSCLCVPRCSNLQDVTEGLGGPLYRFFREEARAQRYDRVELVPLTIKSGTEAGETR